MMHDNLKHLSNEEIETLCKRYYAGEDVETLMRKYKVAVRPASLYKLFPPKVIEDETCEYCGRNLVQDRLPKKMPAKAYRTNYPYCAHCNHRPYSSTCGCQECRDKERLQLMGRLLEGEMEGE